MTEAQAKAEEIQSTLEPSATGAAEVDDLDAVETPESILLSTVSGEQAKDRTDRAVVTPWLKFLWETYRTVLEILKNNARLEIMYQETALQAFVFCQRYARKTEFRRLCELLRNHLQNAAKYQSQMHAINLSDPDTLQRHLNTRFSQLNVAAELELWQEAFRSVEDIHNLLTLSKRMPKNVMMANYYEKLTRIFIRSENYHFHAAAQNRYYKLLRQSAAAVAAGQSPKKDNPSVSEADLTRAASFVLLSSLAIPVISTSRSRGALLDADETRRNKNTRLTSLLNMAQAPTRGLLFKDALNMGLLKRVKPEIRELYQILEVDFHPLSICKRISPILTQIGSDHEMAKYIEPLQQVILTRLFQQLSQVYESVELKFVYDLAQFPEPYQKDASFIEKFIMNGCKKGDFSIRLDHASGVLTFDSDVFSSAKALHPSSSTEGETGAVQRLQSTPAEIVRSQLTRLAKTLYVTCQYVDPSFNAQRQQEKQVAFARASAGADQEHQDILSRRAIIEKKKELATDAAQKKQKEEENRKRFQAQELAAKEAERLRLEEEARAKRRRDEEAKKVKQENLAKEIEELKKITKGDLGEMNMDELDSDRLRQIKLEHLAKEKNELQSMTKITAKRIDHLERAFRKEELKHLAKDYEAQRVKDLAIYEQTKTETLEAEQQKHKEAVALKARLTRLLPHYDQFRNDLQEKRHDEFERRRRKADKELEEAIKTRKRDVREKKAKEKSMREEAERRAREEEERLQREEEERAAREAEEAQKKEEDRARRQAEREEAAEKARLQQQREEEAIARRAAQRRGAPPGPERSVRADEPSQRPVLNIAGKTPNWREREAQKAAEAAASGQTAEASGEVSAPAVAEPVRRSGYVPPAMRNRTAESGNTATARDASSDAPDRWRPRPRGDAPGRDESPAEGSGARFLAPGRRDGGFGGARDASPASGPGDTKFVPRHLRDGGSARPEAPPMAGRQGSGAGAGGAGAGSSGRYVPPSRRQAQ